MPLVFESRPIFTTFQVNTPVFSPSPGTYNSTQTVSILDAVNTASLYYTTDGTLPSYPPAGSTQLYSGPLSVSVSQTLNALGVAPNYQPSLIGSATYTLQALPPTFSPAAGSYSTAQSVTLSSPTVGASIYYTIDGSTPTYPVTGSTTLYTGPLSVAASKTIKAISVLTGYTTSTVASAAYTISSSLVFTGATLPAATQYASYSQSLAPYTSGGTAPYFFSYVSGGVNQGYSNSGQNLTVTPNIPFTESVVYQVTDSATPTPNTAQATFTLPINYVIPAGAQALGYTQLQWIIINPTLSQVNPGPYANTTENYLYNGFWPYSSPSFSDIANINMVNGVMQLTLNQTSGFGQTYISTQNTNGSGPPAAGFLPWVYNGTGYYVDVGMDVTAWTQDNWFTAYLMATAHNNTGAAAVTNPAQSSLGEQYGELDIWEGAMGTSGLRGNLIYHNGPAGSVASAYHSNSYTGNPVMTVPGVYGASYAPSTGTATWYINNQTTGNRSFTDTPSPGGGNTVNSTSLAWLNTQYMSLQIAAQSHGANTPYGLNLYYAAAFGPPTGGGAVQVFNYPNFNGSPNVTLSSDANSISGGQLFIANGTPGAHEAGGAAYSTQINISGGFTSNFTFVCPAVSLAESPVINAMSFCIQDITNNGNPYGFDHAAFSADANMGGYGWYTTAVAGQYNSINSVAIVLIWSYQNFNATDYKSGGQPSTIGMYINGGNKGVFIPEQDMVPFGINLYSGHTFAGTVVYDSTNLTLTFVIQDTSTLAQARFTWPLNIPLAISSNLAWLGFTAGTAGSVVVTTAINSWSVSTGINTRLATPTLSPAGGSYSSTQTVTISYPSGSTCYYTTNGLTPTSASTLYTGPITVSANQYVQAVAIQSNWTDSYVGTGNYLINATNTINFGTNMSGSSGLVTTIANAQLTGSTIYLNNPIAESGGLGPGGTYGVVGASWYVAPLSIGTFTTVVGFTAGANTSGLCLVFQNQNPASSDSTALAVTGGPFAVGGGGQGLGYSQPTGTGTTTYGFQNSLAVFFNTQSNTIGVATNGALPGGGTSVSGVTLASGHPMQITAAYNGTTLSVTIKDLSTLATAGPYTFTENIASLVGASTAYVGVTAASYFPSSGNSGTITLNTWTM